MKRTAELYRIYRAGGGSANPVELPPALADRVAVEASRTAEDLFSICARALHYCPVVDITFGDFRRALITAHYEVVQDDVFGYRDALMQAFRLRGILPSGVRFFSEDALRWSALGLPPCAGLVLQDSRELDKDQRDHNQQLITDWVRANTERLQFEPLPHKNKYHPSHPGALRGIYYYRLRRNDELGYETDDLFVVLRQSRPFQVDPANRKAGTFRADGGVVLVFAANGSVRYAIPKGLRDTERVMRTRDARASMIALGLTTADSRYKLPVLSFAAMHRAF